MGMERIAVIAIALMATAPAFASSCSPLPTAGTTQAAVIAACGAPDVQYYPMKNPADANPKGPLKYIWVNGSGGEYDIVWFDGGVVRNAAHTHN